MTGWGGSPWGSGPWGDGGIMPTASGITYTIEVAFTVALLGSPAGADWTNITLFVRDFSTRRGRSHELGRMQAGEASFTLDNLDRRFDPTNAAGPYYPNVIPMRHIRIRATTPTTTYDLFHGFVDDWGQQWSGPAASGTGDATAMVHAVDALAVLNLLDLTSYPTEVLNDAPLAYFPLDDTQGVPRNLGSQEVTGLGPAAGTATFGAAGPLIGGATAANATRLWRTAGTGELSDDPWKLRGDWTAEAWLYWLSSGGGTDIVTVYDAKAGIPADPYLNLQTTTSAGSGRIVTQFGAGSAQSNAGVLTNAAWNHLAVTKTNGGVTFYVNGVAQGTGTVAGTVTTGTPLFWLAGNSSSAAYRLAHIAVYDTALPAARIAAHYAARIGFLASQPVDTAIGAVLSTIGWPTSTLTGSGHTISAHIPDPNALTELLMLAEDTDGGILFAHADGSIRFRSSADLQDDTVTAASWGDSSAELKYSGLTLRNDEQDLYSEVRASAANLPDAVATNAGAMTTYGARRLLSNAGVLADANQLTDRATGYLNRYDAPAVRPETLLAVDSASQPTRADEMFSSEIGRRVSVTRRPPGGGSAMVLTTIVEGVSHSPVEVLTQMRTTLNLAPVLDPTPWILADTTNGVLGSTTDLGW